MDFRGNINDNIPLVTVGVTSYNYARYIQQALDSLLTQTYGRIQLIIIDDASSDGCQQLIEAWIKRNNVVCTYISHSQNKGITKTHNEILALAKGKYICFMATDDIMLPERVERQAAVLEQAGAAYGLCYAIPQFMDEESNPIQDKYYTSFGIYEGDVLQQYVEQLFRFVTPTAMINRAVYEKIGNYDERVLIEDYNLFIRLVAAYKVKHCAYPCIIYRIKQNTSAIFLKTEANNNERYYHDRIISNAEALKFIYTQPAKRVVLKKIDQYLKQLAANDSSLFLKLCLYLFFKGYWQFSPKLFFIKLRSCARSLRLFRHAST